jgi:hypothetical protein
VSDILSKAREIPRGIGGYHHDIVQEMIAEIERLRAERDEARRECCRHMAHGVMSAEDYAKYLNWDCFKEPAHAS